MAYCDNCGEFFRGGSIRNGSFVFCSGVCQESGARLSFLDEIPAIKVENYVEVLRAARCNIYAGLGPCDVHPSFIVTTGAFTTRTKKRLEYSCRKCARKRQFQDALKSMVCGIWGIPWGPLLTPVYIVKNLLVILIPVDKFGPSHQLRRMARINYANWLAKIASNDLPFPKQ